MRCGPTWHENSGAAPPDQERLPIAVPSSEAYVRVALMGWGVGVAPLVQVQGLMDQGALVPLMPAVMLEVELFWHQWRLGADADDQAGARIGMLDRIGIALAAGARVALGSELVDEAGRSGDVPNSRPGKLSGRRPRVAQSSR